jgi:hypothetical protein
MDLVPESQQRNATFFWWGICACVVLAIFLRSLPIGTRSFEVDEVYELCHLSTDLFHIAKDSDGFPPTFRWFLSLYVLASGEEFSRLLCVFLGVITVVVCAVLGRKIGGDLIGFNTALLLSVSASQVAFGQQIRAYTLYALAIALVMLSGWMLAHKVSGRNWMFFIASSFLAMGSHYYSIYFLAIVWMFVLWNYPKKEILVYFGYAGLFACLCIPWLVCLRVDLSAPLPPEWISNFDLKSLAYLYLTVVQGKFLGPSQSELLEIPWQQGMIALAPWAISGLTFAAILIFGGIRKVGLPNLVWLLSMLLILPVVAGTIAMLIGSNFGSRYLAPLSVPLAIVIACGMSWRGKSISVIATYGLIALNLLSVFNRSLNPRYDRENYRELISKMCELDKEPAVIVLSHYVAPAIRRELVTNLPFCSLGLGVTESDDWQTNLSAFLKKIKNREFVFLVATSTQAADVNLKQRDKLTRELDAKLIQRVSNSTDLFAIETKKLRSTVINSSFSRDR